MNWSAEFSPTPKRDRLNNNLLKFLFGGIILVLVATTVLYVQSREIKDTQIRNRDIGLQNGARQCRILRALGQEISETTEVGACLHADTLRYWDPEEVSAAGTVLTQIQRSICTGLVGLELYPDVETCMVDSGE